MQYPGLSTAELESKGALHTAKEISQQPFLWKKIFEKISANKPALGNFLKTAYRQCDNIILTGAGTSAFIGLSLHGLFFRKSGIITRAVATTDLVSHPQDYFSKDKIPLVVSFARSGNSPESCAALDLADKFSKKCFHLIITCHALGELASFKSIHPAYIFVLPDEANDKSLAMTSSYTGMLLLGVLIANLDDPHKCSHQTELLCGYGERILNLFPALIKKLAAKDFKRAVFLGSGALYGTATEAQLKLQELTNGRVICKTDTYLGFRHGPKAVIDETTLVMYFFSNDEHVLNYEKDLVHSMKKGNKAMMEISVAEGFPANISTGTIFSFSENGAQLDEAFLPVCSILPAQLLAFFKSLQLGLMPDSPSVNGAISRVVEGVNIYPMEIIS